MRTLTDAPDVTKGAVPPVGSRILGAGFASLFFGTPFLSLIAAPGGLVWTAALLALAATLFALSSRWHRADHERQVHPRTEKTNATENVRLSRRSQSTHGYAPLGDGRATI
jgi:hypothetical protein